jgi:hypothetical protein
MSRTAWILPLLKKQSGIKFYITPAVKYELVDRPLTIKRFQFEALEVMKMIREGVLEIYTNVPSVKVKKLQKLANSSFKIKGKSLEIIQEGEIESVACALQEEGASVVIDERTLRLFIENNEGMKGLLEHRFHRTVTSNKINMDAFSSSFSGLKIIRSIELVSVAYKMGLLNSYLPKRRNGPEILLNSILWATKYNGCAVGETEIQEIKGYLLR